jgi:hypothetical protein
MAVCLMADADHREQHNHGSGTFVGGDVHGGFWQIFVPPYGKSVSSQSTRAERRPEPDDEERDDYEDRMAALLVSAWLAATAGAAVVYALLGRPWVGQGPAPGVAARVVGGFFASYLCLAATAAFFARVSQVFEVWSEHCAITATQSRGRLVARPPASMSRAMAGLTAGAALVAELLASLYGWSSYGGSVARRAHQARLNAAANAKSALAAARRP